MKTSRCAPAAIASSTAYWISGLSTIGSISLGDALVAGRKRVPRPATGNTAVRIGFAATGSILWMEGADQSRMGRSAPLLTRSRRSLPGLKCGTYLPASATASPVFGLRPWRGGRKCSEKLPNPRISMRSPCDSESLMISSICLSASSTSFAGRCFCFAVMISINSDFVMAFPGCERLTAIRPVDLLLEQIPEAGSRGRHFRPIALHRLRFFVNLFRLDRQRDGAGLAIHADELGLHLVADLQYRTRIVHPVAAEFRGAQLALDAVAQVDHRTARIHVLDRALDDTALRILGNEGRERILGQLLDTE